MATRQSTDKRRRLSAAGIGILAIVVALLSPAWSHAASALPSEASTSSTAPLLIVLDLSGSMNDDDGSGTIKLAGAKSALSDLIRALPAGRETGLWAYPRGSQEIDGCPTGEAVVPVAPLDPVQMSALVQSLTADAGTPTGPALLAAVDSLMAQGYAAGTIVLVSDGESNCGPDPCDVASQIVQSGFDITVEATGFRTSEAGRAELECVASATGGTYQDVTDSQALADRLAVAGLPALTLTHEGLDGVVVGGARSTITATVANDTSFTAMNVVLSLTFQNAGPDSLFPAVVAPRLRLGNVPPGQSLTRSWTFTVGKPGQTGAARPQLVASGQLLAPVSASGIIAVTKDLTQVGPLLSTLLNGGRLAIIGDSYSSGEGSGVYFDESDRRDNRCHRSPKTYAMELFDAPQTANMACSGAVIADFARPKQSEADEAAQSSSLASMAEDPTRSPSVVLMTFGGNDVGFANIIKTCAWLGDCTTAEASLPRDDGSGNVDTVPFPQKVFTDIALVKPRLTQLYLDVDATVNSSAALAARDGAYTPLIVLAYPQVFPDSATVNCPQLSNTEKDFGIQVGRALNTAISEAVTSAQEKGVEVYFAADVAEAVMPDHSACSALPYINPLDAVTAADGVLGPSVANKELLHPNTDGYAAMTIALVTWSQKAQPLNITRRTPVATPSRLSVTVGPVVDLKAPPSAQSIPVPPSATVRVTGDGFAPGSDVTLTVRSIPQVVGVMTADAEGAIDSTITLPVDLIQGRHVLAASGQTQDGGHLTLTQRLDVRGPIPAWIALLGAVSAAAVLLGLLAALVLAISRMRERRAQSQSVAGSQVARP